MIIRFCEPSSGVISINGDFLTNIARTEWNNVVNIVFQDPYLYHDTIKNNILMGKKDIISNDLYQVCQIAAIHNFIQSLPNGYDTVIGERGITLSGGQRQRIAIARALIRKPEILILDEATSALDLITEKEIQDNIDQFRKGKTTIIIAHRLSTVKNSDRIYVLNKGSIVEEGLHQELILKKGNYYMLVHFEENETSEKDPSIIHT